MLSGILRQTHLQYSEGVQSWKGAVVDFCQMITREIPGKQIQERHIVKTLLFHPLFSVLAYLTCHRHEWHSDE